MTKKYHNHTLQTKERKGVKIRNRYIQVPYLTQDTTRESDKTKLNITNESQEVSALPSTHGIVRKYPQNKTQHQEDKQSKATSSLIPIKMIAKLEMTQSNVQQNIEQTQNLTMGATINNDSTTTEPLP